MGVVDRVVHNGKESELECAIILHEFPPWRSMCAKECAMRIPTAPTHRHILFEFTNTSAMKLVVEPRATVGLGLCSDAFLGVSHDFIFTALELSALKRGLSGLPMNRITQ